MPEKMREDISLELRSTILDMLPDEEYRVNSDAYSEKEKECIEKMYEFINTFQRFNVEEYEVLKKDLKEELHIKDSYNPFD